MTEGHKNPISRQTSLQSSAQMNMVEDTQLSNRRGLDNIKMKYRDRAAISLDSNAIKKLTEILEDTTSNVSSLSSKLDTKENSPTLKSKSQSNRERNGSNRKTSDIRLCKGIKERG